MTTSALEKALNGLSRLRGADMTYAPLHPNREMIAAGARAAGVDPDLAWIVYEAMINECLYNPIHGTDYNA